MNLKWGPNVTVFHLIIRNICAGSGELVFENCLFIHLCIFVCLISLSESKGNMGQQRWFSPILATNLQILYLLEFFVWSGLESRCWEAEFSPSSTSLSSSIYVSINKKYQSNKTLWDTNIFWVVNRKFLTWKNSNSSSRTRTLIAAFREFYVRETAKDFLNILISDKNYSWNINQTWPPLISITLLLRVK